MPPLVSAWQVPDAGVCGCRTTIEKIHNSDDAAEPVHRSRPIRALTFRRQHDQQASLEAPQACPGKREHLSKPGAVHIPQSPVNQESLELAR